MVSIVIQSGSCNSVLGSLTTSQMGRGCLCLCHVLLPRSSWVSQAGGRRVDRYSSKPPPGNEVLSSPVLESFLVFGELTSSSVAHISEHLAANSLAFLLPFLSSDPCLLPCSPPVPHTGIVCQASSLCLYLMITPQKPRRN